jgi:hypothetical protein
MALTMVVGAWPLNWTVPKFNNDEIMAKESA